MKKTNIIPATTKNAIILSRPIPNLMNSQIKSSVNNIESIIDNSRFRDLENNIKLSGFEKDETSCGSFLVYPIKIDGKSIHTYS